MLVLPSPWRACALSAARRVPERSTRERVALQHLPRQAMPAARPLRSQHRACTRPAHPTAPQPNGPTSPPAPSTPLTTAPFRSCPSSSSTFGCGAWRWTAATTAPWWRRRWRLRARCGTWAGAGPGLAGCEHLLVAPCRAACLLRSAEPHAPLLLRCRHSYPPPLPTTALRSPPLLPSPPVLVFYRWAAPRLWGASWRT